MITVFFFIPLVILVLLYRHIARHLVPPDDEQVSYILFLLLSLLALGFYIKHMPKIVYIILLQQTRYLVLLGDDQASYNWTLDYAVFHLQLKILLYQATHLVLLGDEQVSN